MARKSRKPKRDPNSPAAILRREKAKANREKHTARILEACSRCGLVMPTKEHRFHPERKWRFDFAWPELKLAIEVNGGGGRGRHNSVTGATADAEKMNAAQLLGWRVLIYTCKSVLDVKQIASDLAEASQKRPMANP